MEKRKIELLSPAGDMERLRMAVAYGADSVYLAGTAFGMRAFAGNFSPEELPGKLEGSFGLVWDGASTESCKGAYGAYLMINSPHKLSLYLAAGMPVAVWSRSAQADLVRAEGVGLVIDRIADLPAAIAALTEEEYAAMAQRARTIGEALRAGNRTLAALQEIENS